MMKEADFNETSVHIYQNTIFIIALYYKYGRQSFFTRDCLLFDALSFRTDCILFYFFETRHICLLPLVMSLNQQIII
jgi:hypothetical protein